MGRNGPLNGQMFLQLCWTRARNPCVDPCPFSVVVQALSREWADVLIVAHAKSNYGRKKTSRSDDFRLGDPAGKQIVGTIIPIPNWAFLQFGGGNQECSQISAGNLRKSRQKIMDIMPLQPIQLRIGANLGWPQT